MNGHASSILAQMNCKRKREKCNIWLPNIFGDLNSHITFSYLNLQKIILKIQELMWFQMLLKFILNNIYKLESEQLISMIDSSIIIIKLNIDIFLKNSSLIF